MSKSFRCGGLAGERPCRLDPSGRPQRKPRSPMKASRRPRIVIRYPPRICFFRARFKAWGACRCSNGM